MTHREHDQKQPMPTQKEQSLSLIDAALAYAQNGWPVFPLHGKVPYKYLLPDIQSHGHKDATTDIPQILKLWEYHPGANIGLPTGNVSGVIVVDMDVPEGYYNIKTLQT